MRALLVMVLGLSACAPLASGDLALQLPSGLEGKVAVLAPSDPAYAQANRAAAVMPEGQGGVSDALVVRLARDLPVYRMWNGPVAEGRDNRKGAWWAFDAPKGTREGYRRAYEICGSWNQLTWVATCTLKQGAVVAIGPGQSVSAEKCEDASGYEAYDANRRHWQVYVHQAWARADLSCPPDSADYRADPANVSQPAR